MVSCISDDELAVPAELGLKLPSAISGADDAESPDTNERKLVRIRIFSSDSRIASSTASLRICVCRQKSGKTIVRNYLAQESHTPTMMPSSEWLNRRTVMISKNK